jgi:hypothetical protein
MQIRPTGLPASAKASARASVRLHGAAGAFDGKVGEILRRTETAGNDQRIEVFGVGLADVLDLATGDARRLHQHVARLGHFFAGQVIDHVHLRDVRGKALHLRAALVRRSKVITLSWISAPSYTPQPERITATFCSWAFLQIHGVKCPLICHSLP